MKSEKGFTLIEMLIVLLIISILILVTVPNVTKHFKTIDDKGCEAYKSMVQSQVEAYKIDNRKYPTVDDLKKGSYLPEGEDVECPNGDKIAIEANGEVVIIPKKGEQSSEDKTASSS